MEVQKANIDVDRVIITMFNKRSMNTMTIWRRVEIATESVPAGRESCIDTDDRSTPGTKANSI